MRARNASAEYRGSSFLWVRALGVLGALAGILTGGRATARPGARVPPTAVAPTRLAALSAAYRGTPYKLDCLGEARHPDRDPLYTRKFVDCQTLVEQVMAEALAPHVGGLNAAVQTVRYLGEDALIQFRYHYCIPDWLTYPWPARDITAEVGGGVAKSITRRIDRTPLLVQRGATPSSRIRPRTVTTSYIPRSQVRSVLSRIPDGSIVVFVLDRPGIVAGHLGFAFRSGKSVTLRHASQRKMRVIDEPLSQFIGTARKSVIGIKVLQPDVAGLQREVSF